MLKTIFKSLRAYRRSTWQTVFCSAIEAVFEIIIPLWMARLIDKGIEAGQMQQVWLYGLLLLLFALLQVVTGVLAARLGANASAGFAANLRQDMFDRVQHFSFASIDKFSTASMVTRLTTDVTNIRNAFNMVIRMAIRSPMMLIIAMVVSFRINAEISMVYVVVVPILSGILALMIYFAFPIFDNIFASYDTLNQVVQENVRAVRVVKSFNREGFEIEKFLGISEKIRKLYTKAEYIIGLNGPVMQVSMYTSMLLISWIGAHAVVASGNNPANGLTTGELTALFTYSIQILVGLMMISMVFVMIIIASSSAKRVAALLNEEITLVSPENGKMVVEDGGVVFDHVTFAYKEESEQHVLKDINLSFESGQTIGILGGTGSAKSSLVQLIPRLYDVSGGRVLVGGVDVRAYDLDVLRQSVSMVLQKNELFSGTIRENLQWGDAEASDELLRKVCEMAAADDFIQKMPDGYDTYIEQGGVNVSGGQKQRLCIARALLKKPKILILDDSTSAVDTRTDARIQEALKTYLPETTKIIIAQRVSSLQHADQIVIMDDGKVVACGTPAYLLENCGIYRDMYLSQQKEDGE